jgi:hypothetical protein
MRITPWWSVCRSGSPGTICLRSIFWYKFFNFQTDRKQANLREEGLRLLILRMHPERNERLAAEGLEMPIAAARGPMTGIPLRPAGITQLMMEGTLKPGNVLSIHNTMTATIIRGLHAWQDSLRRSESVLPPGKMVGGPKEQSETSMHPLIKRIFGEFDGLIRIYPVNTFFVRGRRFTRCPGRKQQPICAGCAREVCLPDNKHG